MQTTAVNQFSGPAYVAIGDAASTMVDLGLVPNVSFQLLLRRQSAVNEIGQALKDGQWGAVVGARATLSLHNKSAAILAELLPEASNNGSGVTFSEVFAALTLPTLAIVPIAEYGNDSLGTTNIWIPAARPDDIGEFTYQLGAGAGASDDANPYTITFSATLDATATAGFRLAWMGDPAKAGKAWTASLPAGY